MYVNTNVSALNAWNNLEQTNQNLAGVLQQLSSGNRINSAANDPAGLAISQQMTSEINGMQQAYQNAQSGISLLQTADGALGQVQNILQSMRSLASEAAGGTMNATDTQSLQSEMNQYAQEITSITNQTQFNSMNLLGGTLTATTFQIGPDQGQTLGISIGAADAYSLGVTGQTTSITSAGQSAASITNSANLNTDTFTLAATVTPWSAALSGANTTDFTSLSGSGVGLTAADSFTVTVSTAGTATGAGVISVFDHATATTTSYTATAVGTSSTFAVNVNGSTFTLGMSTATTSDSYTATVTPTQTQFVLTDTGSSTSSTLNVNGVIASGTAESMTLGSGALGFTTSTSVYTDTNATYTQTGATAPTAPTAPTATTFTVSQSGSAAVGSNGTLTTQAVASTAVDVTNQADAQAALTVIGNAITKVSTLRSNVGAYQNRLQFAGSDLQIAQTNLQSAQAGITNADMALEMSKLSQYQILQQSGVAMLAQANAIPQALLKLLN